MTPTYHQLLTEESRGGIMTQRGTSLHPLTPSHSGEVSSLQTLRGHPETHAAADGAAIA